MTCMPACSSLPATSVRRPSLTPGTTAIAAGCPSCSTHTWRDVAVAPAPAAVPQTIADGARTLALGAHNWAILQNGLAGIVEVDEGEIREGVRLLSALANVKSEPTGALSTGAVLTAPGRFRGQRVCCVVSGGNVDPQVYLDILSGAPS